MSLAPDTHRSLLLRLDNTNDQAAWNEFVSAYEVAVYRYVRSRGLQDADAREVVQDVLLAVHQSITKWNQRSDRPSFRAWLFRVAFNKSNQFLRLRSKIESATGYTSVFQRIADVAEDDPSDLAWRRWAFCVASSRIQQQVKPSTWQAFYLTAVEQVTPQEVGRQLALSTGTVYASKCRVLAKIREEVKLIVQSSEEGQGAS